MLFRSRLGPDGRLRYGWDELLRLGRGRTLTLRHDPADRDVSVTGVMSGFERSGATVVVLGATGAVRVPMKTVWHVEPAPAA